MIEEMSLADLDDGVRAEVVAIPSGDPNLTRLKEMGLFVKSEIIILRRSPLGDPIELQLKFGRLSIRKSDAEKIKVRIKS